MNDLFCDIGYYSLNKDGETLCGDRVQCVSPNEDDEVIVLADGEGDDADAQREAFFAELGVPALLVDLKEGAVVIALCEAARDAIG